MLTPRRHALIVHPGEFNLQAFVATILDWWRHVLGAKPYSTCTLRVALAGCTRPPKRARTRSQPLLPPLWWVEWCAGELMTPALGLLHAAGQLANCAIAIWPAALVPPSEPKLSLIQVGWVLAAAVSHVLHMLSMLGVTPAPCRSLLPCLVVLAGLAACWYSLRACTVVPPACASSGAWQRIELSVMCICAASLPPPPPSPHHHHHHHHWLELYAWKLGVAIRMYGMVAEGVRGRATLPLPLRRRLSGWGSCAKRWPSALTSAAQHTRYGVRRHSRRDEAPHHQGSDRRGSTACGCCARRRIVPLPPPPTQTQTYMLMSNLHACMRLWQDALRRLWELGFPELPCTALKTPQWKEMGWQVGKGWCGTWAAGLVGRLNPPPKRHALEVHAASPTRRPVGRH